MREDIGGGTMKDRSKVNFVIAALMFLCMMAIAGIGFLMKFVLIPGKERWVKYGRNVDLSLLGMDRHGWGTIHLIIGFILLGLLVLHIVLHWKMILNMYHGLIGSQRARRIIASVFIVASVILITFSFFAKPEVREIGRGEGRQGTGYGYEETIEHSESSIEVAEKYNVPAEYLKEQYGFTINDVERIIDEYHKNH
ncbi:MAG: DUF4405 domain-containing protein [Candidatus Hydrothermarchaeota archaeon]|nr:DUF4405 domain-containing protein [Candidatus Hydrothermarchaeota archaeon]